ncbi:MAG: HAMP domain-containing histidine kinase [Eubacterium sp.]|nr:HAMP domain-containing histidine kinase [Eubacterium sp.]
MDKKKKQKDITEWKDPAVKVQEVLCDFDEILSEKALVEIKEKSSRFIKNGIPTFRKKFPLWWAELLVIGVLILMFIFMFQLEKSYQRSITGDYTERLVNGVYAELENWQGDEEMTERDLREFMSAVMRYNPGDAGSASFAIKFYDQYENLVAQSDPERNVIVRCAVPEGSEVPEIYFNLDDYFAISDVSFYLDSYEQGIENVSYIVGYLQGEEFIPIKIIFENWLNPDVGTYVLENAAFSSILQKEHAVYLVDYDSSFTPTEDMNYVMVGTELRVYNSETDSNIDAFAYVEDLHVLESYAIDDLCNARGGFGSVGSGYSASEGYFKVCGGGVYGIIAMTFPVNKIVLTSAALWSRMISMIIIIQGGGLVGFFLRRKMKQKQAQIDHMRNTFINAMAHEMKTPAAVIKNSTECILDEICPEKNRHYLEMISRETDHMNELLSNMLLYTRTSDSIHSLRPVPVNLKEITEMVSESYHLTIEQRNISLSIKDLGMDQVYADPDLIKMVIDNYISNAVKFAKEESEITITLCANRFIIHNVGEAIPEDQIEHVWEPLYVADTARSETDSSAGMGLAICKNILELHKAEYGVTNEVDGVRFYFKLP